MLRHESYTGHTKNNRCGAADHDACHSAVRKSGWRYRNRWARRTWLNGRNWCGRICCIRGSVRFAFKNLFHSRGCPWGWIFIATKSRKKRYNIKYQWMHKLYTVIIFDDIWSLISPGLGLIWVLELQSGHVKYTDSLRPGIGRSIESISISQEITGIRGVYATNNNHLTWICGLTGMSTSWIDRGVAGTKPLKWWEWKNVYLIRIGSLWT